MTFETLVVYLLVLIAFEGLIVALSASKDNGYLRFLSLVAFAEFCLLSIEIVSKGLTP